MDRTVIVRTVYPYVTINIENPKSDHKFKVNENKV